MFPFFQSPGTFPHCQDFSNAMERGLANPSASPLRTPAHMASAPVGLYLWRFVLSWCQVTASTTSLWTSPSFNASSSSSSTAMQLELVYLQQGRALRFWALYTAEAVPLAGEAPVHTGTFVASGHPRGSQRPSAHNTHQFSWGILLESFFLQGCALSGTDTFSLVSKISSNGDPDAFPDFLSQSFPISLFDLNFSC